MIYSIIMIQIIILKLKSDLTGIEPYTRDIKYNSLTFVFYESVRIFETQINIMRHFFLAFCLSAGAPVLAQPALFKQAIINTTTTIISPEGEEDNMPPPPPPGNNGEEMHMMRFGGDGETKSTTFLKNGLIKTVTNTEMGNNTVIRDSKNKKTTTLMEMMGNKTAFYATDEEQEQMRLRMDSLMKSKNPDQAPSDPISVVIAYTNEIRKIAGYACKKAFIITTRPKGKKDSSIVWYCPDFKLEGVVTTGGLTGGPMSMGLGRPGVSSAFAKHCIRSI